MNEIKLTNNVMVAVDKVKVYKSNLQCAHCGHIPINDAYIVTYDEKTVKCFCSGCFKTVNVI